MPLRSSNGLVRKPSSPSPCAPIAPVQARSPGRLGREVTNEQASRSPRTSRLRVGDPHGVGGRPRRRSSVVTVREPWRGARVVLHGIRGLGPVGRYVLAVTVPGLLLLFAHVVDVASGPRVHRVAEILLFGAFVFLGELRPIRVPRGDEQEEIVTSATFTFAIL